MYIFLRQASYTITPGSSLQQSGFFFPPPTALLEGVWVWSCLLKGTRIIGCCGEECGFEPQHFKSGNHLPGIRVVSGIQLRRTTTHTNTPRTSEEINKAELKINQSLEMSRLRVTVVGPYVPHFIFEVIGNIVYTASGWRRIKEDMKKMRRSHVCFASFRVKGAKKKREKKDGAYLHGASEIWRVTLICSLTLWQERARLWISWGKLLISIFHQPKLCCISPSRFFFFFFLSPQLLNLGAAIEREGSL